MSLPPGSPPRTPPRFVPTLTERVDTALFPLAAEKATAPTPLPDAHQELTAVQAADTNFAARMAVLRNKHRTALETAQWLSPSEQRSVVQVQPEQEPEPEPIAVLVPEMQRVGPNMDTAPAATGAFTASLSHAAPSQEAPQPASPPMTAEQASDLEEKLVHRVLQRLDVALDQPLRSAIASVVQAHSESLLPKLREEVESVVRRAVDDALSNELAINSKH